MDSRWTRAAVALVAAAVVAAGVWWAMADGGGAGPEAGPEPEVAARGDGVEEIPSAVAALDRKKKEEVAHEERPHEGRPPRRMDPRSKGAFQPPARMPRARLAGDVLVDPTGVAAAIDARRKDLEACYETARSQTPDLEESMTLVVELEPGTPERPWGTVASVDAESEVDATAFEGCVATVFEEMKFNVKGPTKVRHPVTFGSEAPAPAP